MTHDKLNLGLS